MLGRASASNVLGACVCVRQWVLCMWCSVRVVCALYWLNAARLGRGALERNDFIVRGVFLCLLTSANWRGRLKCAHGAPSGSSCNRVAGSPMWCKQCGFRAGPGQPGPPDPHWMQVCDQLDSQMLEIRRKKCASCRFLRVFVEMMITWDN